MNRVELTGRLTRDPELRTTQSGVPVCQFSIAVQRKVKDADGNRPSDFFNVVAWRKLAELVSQYLSKGKMCGVSGSLQSRSYEKDGRKVYVVEIIAEDVDFLSPKGETAAAAAPSSTAAEAAYDSNGFVQVDDDELPF